jgi:hypothetical protein
MVIDGSHGSRSRGKQAVSIKQQNTVPRKDEGKHMNGQSK